MGLAKRVVGDVNTIILDAPYSRFLIWEQYDTKIRTVSEARASPVAAHPRAALFDVFDVCYIFLARLGCLSSSVSIWHYSPLTRAEKSSQAIRLGQEAIAQQCAAIEVWAADLGKEKRTEDLKSPPEGLDEIITQQIGAEIEDAYRTISLKKVRGEAVAIIKEKVKESLILADGETQETHPGKYDATTVSMALKRVESRIMRNLVLREGYRADGRGIRDVRPIWSRASMLPRTHGAYHPPYDLILPALIVVSACVHRQKSLV